MADPQVLARLVSELTDVVETLAEKSRRYEDLAMSDALLGIEDSAMYKGGVARAYAQSAELVASLLEKVA